MYLNAGELDQVITVQQRAAGQDSRGQPNGAWSDYLVDISPSNPNLFSEALREAGASEMKVFWGEDSLAAD